MAKEFHEEVKGVDGSDDIMLYLERNLITIHIGYSQSRLTQKDCKQLVEKLKLVIKAANTK